MDLDAEQETFRQPEEGGVEINIASNASPGNLSTQTSNDTCGNKDSGANNDTHSGLENETAHDKEPTPFCTDCKQAHIPRRLVVCVDGTWMDPDGPIDSRSGNATNMFRIWCMVQEGTVLDGAGKQWMQIRAPFVDGIGVTDDYIERIYAGLTGSGFEMIILQVYKECCALCSKDEVFLFGYSRGAFVVRAVAGLLHHMRSLKPELRDFDKKFLKGLREYRAARDKSRLSEHSVFRHLSENTKAAPCIRFLGLIDTVKALDDDNLYDIDMVKSVCHARHALALFERKTVMTPERFDLERLIETKPTQHSIQEAWFAGTHGNLGGSQIQDGLALWVLHWLVTEAQNQGFVTGFKKIENSNVSDPAKLISVRSGDPQMECVHRSGICTAISDFSETLETPGYFPWISTKGSSFPTPEDFRMVYRNGTLIGSNLTNDTSGCFIHPSVFLLDHTDVSVVQAINICPFSKELRGDQRLTAFPDNKLFWALQKELQAASSTKKPRILVCGQVNAGKSSLIDAVLDREASSVSHGATPGQHDTNAEFESESREIILHDSKGFESGTEQQYNAVQHFLKVRRLRPYFKDQVHCIWYCVSTDLPRIQQSDKNFSQLDFGGVPVVLIFTKTDKLRAEKKFQAVKEHNKTQKTQANLEDLGSLPADEKQSILQRASTMMEDTKTTLKREWNERLPVFSSTVFVEIPGYSNFSSGCLTDLVERSNAALSSEVVRNIHLKAQEAYLRPKLKEMISGMIGLCQTKGDFWICFTTFKSEAHRRELTTEAIHIASRILEFEGFRNTALSSTLLDILWPLESSRSAAVPSQALGGLTLGIAAATVKLIPLFAIVSIPLTVANSARSSLKQSNALVFSCVDIILIFDRLFWFGEKHIDDAHVTAAALYYLKIRTQVLNRLEALIPVTKDMSGMGPAITRVVEEFQYRAHEGHEDG